MKFYSIALLMSLFLSSCLKQSITEAMLEDQQPEKLTGVFSCINDNGIVNLTVEDIRISSPKLSCIKKSGFYSLEANTAAGEFEFRLRTNNLTVGNYKNTIANGERIVINGFVFDSFIQYPGDSISVNITSINNGFISGNFSGALTSRSYSGSTTVFGFPGGIIIRNGIFQNVPVRN